MSVNPAVAIGGLAIGIGVALYLPFGIAFWWRRRKNHEAVPGRLGRPVQRSEVPWIVASIIILLAGFSQGNFSPDSWFGTQMKTTSGLALYTLFVQAFVTVARTILLRRNQSADEAQFASSKEADGGIDKVAIPTENCPKDLDGQ